MGKAVGAVKCNFHFYIIIWNNFVSMMNVLKLLKLMSKRYFEKK